MGGYCLSLVMWLNVMVGVVENRCYNCDSCSGNWCSRCSDGYYVHNGICYQCPSTCTTCMSNNDCNSCEEGYHGSWCGAFCDTNCVNTTCYQDDGSCVDGCSVGYYQSGSRCANCSENCEECKDRNHCTRCASGYIVTSFSGYSSCVACPSGKWGDQCLEACSDNCTNTDCNPSDGQCKFCIRYTYGKSCESRCSKGCKDLTGYNVCLRWTGNCVYGCKRGYSGVNCDSARAVVDGQWGKWSLHGQCSVTCGGGRIYRSRLCNDPSPQYGGLYCIGSAGEWTSCNNAICPEGNAVDGHWGQWSDVTSCSVTCGFGTKPRSRLCNDPSPQYGGNDCSGNSVESTTCNLSNCPVDGGWSQWSEFTPCSETCGEGHKTRSRSCDNPVPQSGGIECVGEKYYTMACEQLNCSKGIGQPGAESSDSGALVGGIAGGVALLVVAGVVLAILYRFRKARQNDMQDISAKRTADTQEIELDPEQYEELTERPLQNDTYMELNTTEYESVDEQPRRYSGSETENTGYQNV